MIHLLTVPSTYDFGLGARGAASHSIGSKLLRGGFCSAVPGFAQMGDGGLGAGEGCDEREAFVRGVVSGGIGQFPDFGEGGEAVFTARVDTADQCHHVLLQPVHAGVGMCPGVGEGGRIELTDEFLHQRQLEQARAGGNEEANGVLDRGDVADEIQVVDHPQQIAIAVEADPGIKGDEGRVEIQPEGAKQRDDVVEVGPGMTLVEDVQNAIVDGFDRAGDEGAPGVSQHRQIVLMPQQVLDLDRHVVGEIRESLVQRLDDADGVGGAVEEIGVAEGNVLGAGRDLLRDVGQHDLRWHDEEPAAVHRARWGSGGKGACSHAWPRCSRRRVSAHCPSRGRHRGRVGEAPDDREPETIAAPGR